MTSGMHKIKGIIKSTPLLGRLIANMHGKYLYIKPGGHYWEYDFKAMQFDRYIRKLSSLIGDKKYDVCTSGNGNIQIILKNGIRFWWVAKDTFSLLGMPFRGSFEPDCTDIITKLVKQGDTAFDIGANFGWHSCHLAQLVGKEGRVHVFEPTNVIKELENNLILNGLRTRCVLNQLALGEKEGDESLFIPQKLGTAFASFRAHSYSNSIKWDEISVPVKKLDDYVFENKLNKLDFIKMDIGGAEYLALKGAENVLENYSPIIMLELYDSHTKYFGYSPEELRKYLEGLDYFLYEIDEKEIGSVKRVISFKDTSNYNFLAAKTEDVLTKNGILIK